MLTPQDIQEKEFTKAVFGGYDMSTVDDFLETLSADYSALYKENAILKSKMKVLVDKVEEYRSTEDAMRMALLTAQKLGDDIVAEARKKSENILEAAEAESAERIAEIRKEVMAEETRLEAARQHTAEFVDLAREICQKQLDFLDQLGRLKPEEKPSAAISEEERITDTAKIIEDSLSKIVQETISSESAEEVPVEDNSFDTKPFAPITAKDIDWDDVDEPTSPRPKFNFSDLKFGSNFDKDE